VYIYVLDAAKYGYEWQCVEQTRNGLCVVYCSTHIQVTVF